jgi:hypothetical protein
MSAFRRFANLVLLNVLFYLLISSGIALAGSWSSGGGEILEHAQNPWFIKIPEVSTNFPQKPITYCVEVGPDFPITERQIEALVAESIVWWRREFSNAHLPINKVVIGSQLNEIKVYVNTDMIFKETCDESIDIAFQFGWLSQYQQQELENLKVDLTRYIALSIRTDYSTQLRGKGFIYISPDRGPMAFRGVNIMPNAWTERDPQFTKLKAVVQHELGHVFGLAHGADGGAIMDARFPEKVVDKHGWNPYLESAQSVFFPKVQGSNFRFCKNVGNNRFEVARKIFGIKESDTCFQTFWDLNRFSIYAVEQPNRTLRGTARFTDGGKRRHKQLVSLWLPSDQTLLPGLESSFAVLLGPASTEVQQQGTFVFRNQDGNEQKIPITIQTSPRHFQISTVHEGILYPDLLPHDSYGRIISGWDSY